MGKGYRRRRRGRIRRELDLCLCLCREGRRGIPFARRSDVEWFGWVWRSLLGSRFRLLLKRRRGWREGCRVRPTERGKKTRRGGGRRELGRSASVRRSGAEEGSTHLKEDSRVVLFRDLRKEERSSRCEPQGDGDERRRKGSGLTDGSKLTMSTNFSMWKA